MNDRKYRLFSMLGFINFKWNCFVGWIHDVSAKWGIGHTTVWFYDTFTWSLPNKWQLIGGVPYHEYLLRCELDTAQHQIRYYSNIAYELWLTQLIQEIETEETNTEMVSDKPINKKMEETNV